MYPSLKDAFSSLCGGRKKRGGTLISPASSLNLKSSLTNYADADKLLAVDDVIGGRQLLLVERREHGGRVAARSAVAVERGDEGGREVRHLIRADDGARRDAEELDVEPVVLLHLVDSADELPQVLRDEALRGRSLLQRAAVADEEDELPRRHVGRNLDRDALDELLARLGADVGLHLDGLAAAHLAAVERDAVERRHPPHVTRGDVERDRPQLDALEAARHERLDRRGDGAGGRNPRALHRETALKED